MVSKPIFPWTHFNAWTFKFNTVRLLRHNLRTLECLQEILRVKCLLISKVKEEWIEPLFYSFCCVLFFYMRLETTMISNVQHRKLIKSFPESHVRTKMLKIKLTLCLICFREMRLELTLRWYILVEFNETVNGSSNRSGIHYSSIMKIGLFSFLSKS